MDGSPSGVSSSSGITASLDVLVAASENYTHDFHYLECANTVYRKDKYMNFSSPICKIIMTLPTNFFFICIYLFISIHRVVGPFS